MSKESKKGRSKRSPQQNTAYKTENRRLKNKKRKIIKHLKKHPNDAQSKACIGE